MAPFMLLLLIMTSAVSANDSQELTSDYYSATCPRATEIVRRVVNRAIRKNVDIGPALLRLFQVDCFVNGCDGSILLDDTKHRDSEKKAITNRHSLRGFKVIHRIKRRLEKACPRLVSCADILAFAARDAVVHFGGPTWRVRVGRKDSRNASIIAANSFIPRPEYDLPALVSSFNRVGLNARDLVALSGAHTIGRARCRWYRQRARYDTNIDRSFAESLRQHCRRGKGKGKGRRGNGKGKRRRRSSGTDLDYASPLAFDNSYFRNLMRRRGVLHSDQALYDGGFVAPIVRQYAEDNGAFFRDFARAMVKMGNIQGPYGNIGEVRRHCKRVNKHRHW